MNKKYLHKIFEFVLFAVFVTSCQVETVSQTSLKLERFAIKKNDLPKGWIYSGENWDKKHGGDSYLVGYTVLYSDSIRFVHELTVFSDSTQAVKAFPIWDEEWFNSTKPWVGTKFIPNDSNDKYKYECVEFFTSYSLVSCSFLQQHNKFIVSILVTLDGNSMTIQQLNDILQVLDERLNTVSFE